MTTTETRRGFLSGLIVVAGGVASAALAGCSAPATRDEALPAAGATETVRATSTYGNVMPDHVAAVRLRSTEYVPDWSTSKKQ
jgi:hypothetical protein